MKSTGNKIEYLCPNCRSKDIVKCLIFNVQISFCCNNCGRFGQWKDRLKISLKEAKNV